MTEKKAVSLLQRGKSEGLSWLMEHYARYVAAVVWGILRERMSMRDAEEVTSDVFLALWQARERVRQETIKSYLAAIARAKAINKLRERGFELALEEDILELPTDDPEQILEASERAQAVREAVASMEPPDREIFVRYYYYCQTATEIADALGMNPATVRQRLKRGRERLKDTLTKGDF